MLVSSRSQVDMYVTYTLAFDIPPFSVARRGTGYHALQHIFDCVLGQSPYSTLLVIQYRIRGPFGQWKEVVESSP
jgi:hypothetical protein